MKKFENVENKIILRIKDRVCETAEELISSKPFKEFLKIAINSLIERNSILLNIFSKDKIDENNIELLIKTLLYLSKMEANLVINVLPESSCFFNDKILFNDFVEYLYDYWRSFDRFIICDSTGDRLDKRPYRTFNATIESLTHLIRGVYRDIQENITGSHPRIYRQVTAGAEIATIALPKKLLLPDEYKSFNKISIIRQILLCPPLILETSSNKRTGQFVKIDFNPLKNLNIKKDDWLCYPAKVGPLLILIYFNKKFFDLGFSLCNLFELADDKDLERKPDGIYFFGVPKNVLKDVQSFPTVFYDDEKNDIIVATVPYDKMFGYFGYLKKMVLTMHNIKMMKKGILPFHGALTHIILKGNKSATILIIGDTGAGKSETLEAFRVLSKTYLQDLIIIADDMGSIHINENGEIIGYGTEIGAFLRIDDLKPGYAFGQIDRAIIMNASQINARIILPVTNYSTVMKGYKIDFILYANNYEEIDEQHPVIEKFNSPDEALKVFREGTVASKGTTTSTGIVHSYFANIFGPVQYKELHEKIAKKYFEKFFEKNIFVGQMRTRLAIKGFELKGPEEAAKELFKLLSDYKK